LAARLLECGWLTAWRSLPQGSHTRIYARAEGDAR
jgi:hypothetical protein